MGGYIVDELAEGICGEFPAVPAAGVSVEAGADQAEHGGERDQVRIDAGGGGAGRDGGDHVVHEQECPGFLPGEDLGPAAQDAAGAAEGLLQVQERDFDLPSLSTEDGDFTGRVLLVVQQGGQQPDGAGLRAAAAGAGHDRELDQPGHRARQPDGGLVARVAAAAGPHAVRFAQHDQLRAVGQGLQRPERHGLRAVPDPPAQLRPGRGEPQEPVHGEEPPAGEVQHARCQRGLQLICQGVLPVVIAADRGGDPPVRGGPDQRDQAQHRVLPAGRHPERGGQLVIAVQGGGGPAGRGDLQPVPQLAGAQFRVGAGRVQLERSPRDVLAGPCPGLRQRRPGRHRGSRRDGIQAGHREHDAQHLAVALPGEQAPGGNGQQGVLRGQHPVQLVAVRRRRRRLAGNPLAQELLQQAPAVQALQFLQPQARAGRHPGGQARPQPVLFLPGISISGWAGLRGRHAHGKMAGQRSSCPGR